MPCTLVRSTCSNILNMSSTSAALGITRLLAATIHETLRILIALTIDVPMAVLIPITPDIAIIIGFLATCRLFSGDTSLILRWSLPGCQAQSFFVLELASKSSKQFLHTTDLGRRLAGVIAGANGGLDYWSLGNGRFVEILIFLLIIVLASSILSIFTSSSL